MHSTIGLISDTHGMIRPEALEALDGVEQILHAGDVGGPEVLAALGQVAPVLAVRGNTDTSPWGRSLPLTVEHTLGNTKLLVIHDLHDLEIRPADAGIRAVISGHTHKPLVQEREGVLFINPGAAGARRFSLPICVALLHVRDGRLEVELVTLNA